MSWNANDLPDQTDKTWVITGANSGLGYETSRVAAQKGAYVIMACRTEAKARDAIARIKTEVPQAQLTFMPLDLANLGSVRSFGEAFNDAYDHLHVLCNNAGVMAIPRRETADGFEMQIGTNHFGHFALTARLFDRLRATPGARIVNVSSTMHRVGKMRFDDINWERGYSKWPAYGQSKLANLLFHYALARRIDEHGLDMIAAASHPGYAATNLQFVGPDMERQSLMRSVFAMSNDLVAQNALGGALTNLYACGAHQVRNGDYIGPGGIMELKGAPKKVSSSGRSKNKNAQERLWSLSETLTEVRFTVS